jgi:flagellar motor switch protein FliN
MAEQQQQQAAGTGIKPPAGPEAAGPGVVVPNYLQELPVKVDVMLGSMKLPVKELMNCGPGSVLDVGKRVTDLFDVYINGILVARGEIVMMHDRLGLKITEVVEGRGK